MAAPATTDPAFLLFYALDESFPSGTRANSGSLGSAQDLSVSQSSGTDGIPAVSDGNQGRAADVFVAATGYTTAFRALRGAAATGSAHTARPAFPKSAASDDFAFGVRFRWRAGNTGGGGIETEVLFALGSVANPQFGWGIGIVPNDATTPTGGQLRLYHLGSSTIIETSAFTATGSPPTQYVLPSVWYRALVRIYFSSTGWKAKLYLYREDTAASYTFTKDAAVTTNSNETAFDAFTDVRVHIGYQPVSSTSSLYGCYVDNAWLYDAPLSDDDATSTLVGGLSVPWTQPSWRRAASDCYVALGHEGADFPKVRSLGVGALTRRWKPDHQAMRPRFHFEGFRPGRPWALRDFDFTFDTIGPYSSKTNNRAPVRNLTRGLHRGAAGRQPLGTPESLRDVELTPEGPQRRRGFVLRRAVSTESDVGANLFHFFRNYDDTLRGLYKVGTKLYLETGAGVTQLDTGWNGTVLPSIAEIDNRLVILSAARQKTWRGTSSIESFGLTVGNVPTLASAVGTLTGVFYYAYTEYDPTTGDESGPAISASITLSAQGATLTMPAANSDTRFSQRKIYRTAAGEAPPDLFLIATIATATSYTDSGAANGTVPVGQVKDDEDTLLGYVTSTPPDTFAIVCEHMERLFFAGGATYPERIYPGEAGEVQRWYSGAYLTCPGPVRAMLSDGHRLVAFTDNHVVIFESDWIRGNGVYSVVRTVVERVVGCAGHRAVASTPIGPVWVDRRGIYRFGPDGKAQPLSKGIEDLFPYVNHSLDSRIVVSYNHVRKQIWVSLALGASGFQVDNSRTQTVFVANIETPTEWVPYQLDVSFHGKFDDDANGLQFGLMDPLGVFKQGESSEGDGAEGDETFTTEDDDGISSIAGSIITAKGTPGWTTDALRGMAVLLRDVSTGLKYWYPISANAAGTFTVVGTPNAALAADDGYYIGGIDAFHRTAEHDLESPNLKVIRDIQVQLTDLTQAALYL